MDVLYIYIYRSNDIKNRQDIDIVIDTWIVIVSNIHTYFWAKMFLVASTNDVRPSGITVAISISAIARLAMNKFDVIRKRSVFQIASNVSVFPKYQCIKH